MRLEEQARPGSLLIQRYGDGGFGIGGRRHQGGVVVLPTGVVPWAVETPAGIDEESLRPAIEAAAHVDVLLVGCGASAAGIDRGLAARLRERHGVAVDFMDTGAACRTFNVLLLDGRRVAAALIAV
jgi:uncharacterized protein